MQTRPIENLIILNFYWKLRDFLAILGFFQLFQMEKVDFQYI